MYPFSSYLNWTDLVLTVQPDREGLAGLIPRLLAIPAAEILRRQRYMRAVAHWLRYDGSESVDPSGHAQDDAPAAVIGELEHRMLPRVRSHGMCYETRQQEERYCI